MDIKCKFCSNTGTIENTISPKDLMAFVKIRTNSHKELPEGWVCHVVEEGKETFGVFICGDCWVPVPIGE